MSLKANYKGPSGVSRNLRPRKHRPQTSDLENTDPLKIEMYYGHAITTRTIYVFI